MSMVERVAESICFEVNDQKYGDLPETASYIDRKTHVHRPISDKQEARQLARAAIEAMRDPTDAMIDAGIEADSENGASENPIDIWRAMIDTAIKE